MTLLDIYIVGVVVCFIAGLIHLAKTDDKRCNITEVRCTIIVNGMLSTSSWLGLILLLGSEIYTRRNNDKN